MAERIDMFSYVPADGKTRVEGRQTDLFATGPAEFLCDEIARALLKDPVWKAVFGEFIQSYMRDDYAMRNLPACRIYNLDYVKSYESWFVEGDIFADILMPPSLRRGDTEQIPDTVASALLQQFRRPTFFGDLCLRVPGLNELGKRVRVDKNLVFQLGEDEIVPCIKISLNFRIDLRQWDAYLETDYRTKDEPFLRTLADLRRISIEIDAVDELNETQVKLGLGGEISTTSPPHQFPGPGAWLPPYDPLPPPNFDGGGAIGPPEPPARRIIDAGGPSDHFTAGYDAGSASTVNTFGFEAGSP